MSDSIIVWNNNSRIFDNKHLESIGFKFAGIQGKALDCE